MNLQNSLCLFNVSDIQFLHSSYWLTAEPLFNGVDLSPLMLTILQVVVAVLMLFGLLSLFLYVIPGLTIIWLSVLVYGFLTGFDLTSGIIFTLITLLMIFGNLVDQLIMGVKARQSGASWKSILSSTLAALIFSILMPPFGGIIAALLVLFMFEFMRLRNLRMAGDSTSHMALGCATAVLARFLIGLIMLGLWVVWLWQASELSI